MQERHTGIDLAIGDVVVEELDGKVLGQPGRVHRLEAGAFLIGEDHRSLGLTLLLQPRDRRGFQLLSWFGVL